MKYDPAIIANAVLHDTAQHGLHVDHMKLQKLVFFVHAWSLALHDRPVVDEEPEAWTYGPVFDSLYHKLKGFGRDAISQYIPVFNPQTGTQTPLVPNDQDSQAWETVRQVVNRYGTFSALQLSTLSHEADGPWDRARQEKKTRIPDEAVRDFYRSKLANAPTH